MLVNSCYIVWMQYLFSVSANVSANDDNNIKGVKRSEKWSYAIETFDKKENIGKWVSIRNDFETYE